MRIYACGGDGTVNEVANGVYGHANAALGVIPIGSGNDLIRNFGGPKAGNDGGAGIDNLSGNNRRAY